jgi:hypothetical protein
MSEPVRAASATANPYSLRDLPVPAKLVVTCFMLFVGLGYFSAMVQLHMQHSSKNGEPLPSPGDVVEIFAGWRPATDADKQGPKSKLQVLVTAPSNLPWNGSGSMAAAFFERDDDAYKEMKKDKDADPAAFKKLHAEREGEQLALASWLDLEPAAMKKAYDTGFAMTAEIKAKTITKEMLKDENTIDVKKIMTDRCARCHSAGSDQEKYALETFEQIMKYAAKQKVEIVNGMVRSPRQVGLEKLTQSTHAHLLSFAMLFSLTGFVFAFTSYPLFVRCILAPIVVCAQIADVSCWWLARVDGVGIAFAQAILVTGTVVGLGLLLQIVLSLWNMFAKGGRVVIVFLFLLGGLGFAALFTQAIQPGLDAEKASSTKKVS